MTGKDKKAEFHPALTAVVVHQLPIDGDVRERAEEEDGQGA